MGSFAMMMVLSGVAVPTYMHTVEESRSAEATAMLNTIHLSQKLYKINHGTYWDAGEGPIPLNTVNQTLNTGLAPEFYTTLEFTNVDNDGYTCRVHRNESQGGDPTRFIQFTWDNNAQTLTESRGHVEVQGDIVEDEDEGGPEAPVVDEEDVEAPEVVPPAEPAPDEEVEAPIVANPDDQAPAPTPAPATPKKKLSLWEILLALLNAIINYLT